LAIQKSPAQKKNIMNLLDEL